MIVILNGPSSAGKTTLCRALQAVWPKPLYYFSYDTTDWYVAPFSSGAAGRVFPDPEKPGEALDPVRDFLTVMLLSAAAVGKSGRDAVIDNCLFDTEDVYALYQRILGSESDCGTETLFVRLDVSPEVLEAREKARGDRTPGKALWQLEHRIPREDDAYDLILDAEQPPDVSAARILARAYPGSLSPFPADG